MEWGGMSVKCFSPTIGMQKFSYGSLCSDETEASQPSQKFSAYGSLPLKKDSAKVLTISWETSQLSGENSLVRLPFWCWIQGTALGNLSSCSKKCLIGQISSWGSTKCQPWMLSAKPSGVRETDWLWPSRTSLRYCGYDHLSKIQSSESTSVMMQGMFLEKYFLQNHSGLKVTSSQQILSISPGSHNSAVSAIFSSICWYGCTAASSAGSIFLLLSTA